MEVSMSLNALVRLPLSSSRLHDGASMRHSLFSSRRRTNPNPHQRQRQMLVVEAKGKKGMMARQFQPPPPPLPKIEDDGNPKFVIFIRMANVRFSHLWIFLFLISNFYYLLISDFYIRCHGSVAVPDS